MTVFVDPARHRCGRMVMCHMWADSLDELLLMVDSIGLDRKWIQGHPELSLERYKRASWVHFDVSKGKRALAVIHGAVQTDKYGPVEHLARITGNLEKLETVRRCRKMMLTNFS